jgi:short-subunit dehydrogenase
MSARPVTLITGASGGIGEELARICAAQGHELALVARSQDKLTSLADEIAATGRARPFILALDLSAMGAPALLTQRLAAANLSVEILINNAGFGLIGPAIELDREEQIAMVDLNIRALTDLTLRCLPQIRAHRGRIMNVASIAAFLPGPGMAVYYATKAYVTSFSDALWQELRGSSVSVTSLCPGVTATGFGLRAGFDEALVKHMPAMSARSVAELGYRAMMKGKRRVITGLFNRLLVASMPLTPRALLLPALDQLMRKRQGRKPPP